MVDLFEIQVGARFGWRTGLLEWSAKRPEGASRRCLRCNALIVGVVSMQLSLWLTLVSLGGEGKYNQTSLLSFLMFYCQTSQQVLLLRDITFEILWHRALELSQALLQCLARQVAASIRHAPLGQELDAPLVLSLAPESTCKRKKPWQRLSRFRSRAWQPARF